MGFQLSQQDNAVIGSVEMILIAQPLPIDGFPEVKGSQNAAANLAVAAATAKTTFKNGTGIGLIDSLINTAAGANGPSIPFQFPPMVTNDAKSGIWKEFPTWNYEPGYIYAGSTPRKIGIKAEYIVTGNDPFTVEGIGKITHLAKSHLYRGYKAVGVNDIPIIQLKIYESAPSSGNLSTWRLLDVSISHGDTLITQDGKTFPLKTTITWSLEMATKLSDRDGKNKIDVSSLVDKPLKEWY